MMYDDVMYDYTHDGSMVLVYIYNIYADIKGVFVDGIHVTIYSSTMDPMGYTA